MDKKLLLITLISVVGLAAITSTLKNVYDSRKEDQERLASLNKKPVTRIVDADGSVFEYDPNSAPEFSSGPDTALKDGEISYAPEAPSTTFESNNINTFGSETKSIDQIFEEIPENQNPQVCTVAYTSSVHTVTGKLYLIRNQIKGELETIQQDGKYIRTDFLKQRDRFYFWSVEDRAGFIVDIDQNINMQSENFLKSSLDEGTYTCTDGDFDMGVFTVPSDVVFSNLTEGAKDIEQRLRPLN